MPRRTAPLAASALILALTAAPLSAQDRPAKPSATKPGAAKRPTGATPARPKPTAKAPAITDRASRDGFGVLQVAAPDARQFIADWRTGTASKSITTRTVADQPLFVFLIFHGCKANAEGKCDIVADFAIHRPDGSVDEDHKDFAVWNKPAPDDATKPVLGDGALGFGTDTDGPFGDYRIVATVTDRVAGITLHTQQVLTVARGDAPAKPVDPAKVEGPTL